MGLFKKWEVDGGCLHLAGAVWRKQGGSGELQGYVAGRRQEGLISGWRTGRFSMFFPMCVPQVCIALVGLSVFLSHHKIRSGQGKGIITWLNGFAKDCPGGVGYFQPSGAKACWVRFANCQTHGRRLGQSWQVQVGRSSFPPRMEEPSLWFAWV